MTREEAKTFLLQLHTDKQLNKSEHEALRIAIKALEREPKLQNRCFALTQGQMCLFCPYECEHKAESEG